MMRFLIISALAYTFGLVACGPAEFASNAGSQKAAESAATGAEATGVLAQAGGAAALCAENGMVLKQDSASDDDSTSVDDDSVDGLSADGISSDDDSSDDKACADLAGCLKKKCDPAPVL